MRAIRPWGLLLVLAAAVPAGAEDAPVVINGETYASWSDYVTSDTFKNEGRRCATPEVTAEEMAMERGGSSCTLSSTTIDPQYEPANGDLVEIRVVVHVLTNSTGTQGNLSDQLIESQIEVLNEDFRAVLGSNGEEGADTKIQFTLAGITRTANDSWFNDSGAYYNTLSWDPDLYLNIYTNQAGGALGYVPGLPQSIAGAAHDRVVVYWRSFGSPSSFPPYDLGRTTTHEVGHYLGLYHTFDSGCGVSTVPGCYSSGDRICDTEAESGPEFNCPVGSSSCGSPDPVHNYMDYSTDICMNQFTPEQANRIRCSLFEYRSGLLTPVVAVGNPVDARAGYLLAQNRPNPFNPTTEISFELSDDGHVSLVVMDVTGRIIRTLAEGQRDAGEHRVTWDGRGDAAEDLASGVYFYRLQTEEGSQTRRMILLK